ncbi:MULTISPECIES: RNA polymerase sigma factor [Pseudoalteromonas]|uniref:RNA polymerase sigma factor n=1 Tax=Pseudoalteromonas TaxID=53246 RepID=UPI00031F5566|nr:MULTISPECIES: RNA polymerase sigma factor [Pseudoalteromonas]MCF6146939.1 RNA polymerase sigma-70 factor, ECF subfamily [Pseudoalteromonas mariniglutinosa NCIMB 1770]
MNKENTLVRTEAVKNKLAAIYRDEGRRIYATLIRLLGDFELAEEALHDAFSIAMTKWQVEGIPNKPANWLVSTGRFKAIDQLRRQHRHREIVAQLASELPDQDLANDEFLLADEQLIADDQLRLIFTCCHPALDTKVQVALTLREVCGLTTEQIASAFLTSVSTMAQRIVRGKQKIRTAHIPFQLPPQAQLEERIDAVLSVIYLVYNEGYSSSAGDSVTRTELTTEAIRLARQLQSFLADKEITGLLALMLLNESRRNARINKQGDIILLAEQDRSLWNQTLIQEGIALVKSSTAGGEYGFYTLQAAIAAEHAQACNANDTNWQQVLTWYSLLLQVAPSPVIELNRAVAVAMHHGPEAALLLVEQLLQQKVMQKYHLCFATYAELLGQVGRKDEARTALKHALTLTKQAPEQRILKSKLAALSAS